MSYLTQGTSQSDEGPLRAPEDDRVLSTSPGPRLSLTPSEQSFAAGKVILAEEDRCLHVSAIHLLEQDRYVT